MMLAYQPIRSLATIIWLRIKVAAFKRISKIIDKKIIIKDDTSLPNLIIKNSDINFKNVDFKYETTKKEQLKIFRLRLKEIQWQLLLVIVERKSTIINHTRFYDPQEGSIEIDKQNIKNITLNSLRKNISLVSQDVILFDDTINNNISYAKENASPEEIRAACKFAAADEFIEKLPQGYETMIGENGVRLSGGQKQRVSIACDMKSPIILLDEAILPSTQSLRK